jgi:hypothetical protein
MSLKAKPRARQPRLAVAAEPRRVRNLAALFGSGYEWDGACECGADDWVDSYWKGGWRVDCHKCGRWVCYHEAGAVAHTSEGQWAPYSHNRRPQPPTGCPSLTEARPDGPEPA